MFLLLQVFIAVMVLVNSWLASVNYRSGDYVMMTLSLAAAVFAIAELHYFLAAVARLRRGNRHD